MELLCLCLIGCTIYLFVTIQKLQQKIQDLEWRFSLFKQTIQRHERTKESPNDAVSYEQSDSKESLTPEIPSSASMVSQPFAKGIPSRPLPPRPPAPTMMPPNRPPQKSLPIHTPNTKGTLEQLVGGKVIAILASLLVFIGLLFLGTLAYQGLSSELKGLFLITISVAITGVGVFLAIKYPNPFSISLAGCGTGSLFITIFIIHIFFGLLNDAVAMSCVLIWVIASLFLSKLINHPALSYIAHFGVITNCIYAFATLTDSHFGFVLLYQLITIIVLLVSNLFFTKKTYLFGLLLTQFLCLIEGFVMIGAFFPSLLRTSTPALPLAVILGAFILQFLLLSTFNYMVTSANTHLEHSSVLLQIFNTIIWVTALTTQIIIPFYYQLPSTQRISRLGYILLIGVFIIIIHMVLSLMKAKILTFKNPLLMANTLITVPTVLLFLFIKTIIDIETNSLQMIKIVVPFFLLFGFLLIIFYYLYHANEFIVFANISFGIEVFIALFYNLFEIQRFHGVFLPVLLTATVLFGLMIFLWVQQKITRFHFAPYAIAGITILQFCFFPIFNGFNTQTLIAQLLVSIVAYIIWYATTEQSLKTVLYINEGYVLLFGLTILNHSNNSPIIKLLIGVLVIILAFMRLSQHIQNRTIHKEQLFTAIKFTLITLSVFHAFGVRENFIISIICMLTALLCIIGGFILKGKHLRTYGLILTILCVLKLALIDIAFVDTILRFVAMILAGIICFIISAIYAKFDKKLTEEEQEEHSH